MAEFDNARFSECLAVVLKFEGVSGAISRLVLYYLVSMTSAYSEQVSKILKCWRICFMDVSNGLYETVLIFRKIAVFSMLFIQSRLSGMSVVFSKCSPLQIAQAVICFVSVFVINGNSVNRWAWKKRFCNESMKKSFVGAIEGYNDIASIPNSPFYWSAFKSSFPAVFIV